MSKTVDQVAALPLRWDGQGRLRVLMVTSRDTGRWVMPKGWTMVGKKPWRAAEIEALEEAGVTGHVSRIPIGAYRYDKIMEGGDSVPCRVTLFPMIVQSVKRRWKERRERKRRWFSVKGAARAVDEPDLVEILAELEKKPRKHPVISHLRRAS
jgi:8-oxo-dGTP pyrophosphatase MutT (NUDIX family)